MKRILLNDGCSATTEDCSCQVIFACLTLKTRSKYGDTNGNNDVKRSSGSRTEIRLKVAPGLEKKQALGLFGDIVEVVLVSRHGHLYHVYNMVTCSMSTEHSHL